MIGSTLLVQTLLEHDLVAELRLMIDPRWWRRQADLPRRRGAAALRLVSTVTTTGAILATYAADR